MIHNLLKKVNNGLRVFSGLMLAAIVAIIFIQVITRFVFFYSLPWAPEVSRYLFVWVIFLSLNLAIEDGIPIRIDFIDQFIKGKGKKVLDFIENIILMCIIGVFTFSSFKLVEIGLLATSPAMGLPMYFVYIAMPVGLILAIVETAKKVSLKRGDIE